MAAVPTRHGVDDGTAPDELPAATFVRVAHWDGSSWKRMGGGVDAAVVRAQRVAGHLGDLPRELDAGRAGPPGDGCPVIGRAGADDINIKPAISLKKGRQLVDEQGDGIFG